MQVVDAKEKTVLEVDTTKERIRTIHRTVRTSKDAKSKYVLRLELDFTTCTHGDLIKLATEAVWIKIQSRFRSTYPKGVGPDVQGEGKKWERLWNVKDEIVNAEKAKATPLSRAAAALAAMSAAEKEAFFAMVREAMSTPSGEEEEEGEAQES